MKRKIKWEKKRKMRRIMKQKIMLVMAVIMLIFTISGCNIESVKEHDAKAVSKSETKQDGGSGSDVVSESETKHNDEAGSGVVSESETNTAKKISVTVTVECTKVVDNDSLRTMAKIPEDGYFLRDYKIEIDGGMSAYEALDGACKNNDITLSSDYASMFETYYVYGIGKLLEKECGASSGWKYNVNGESQGVGLNNCTLKDGDTLILYYAIEAND